MKFDFDTLVDRTGSGSMKDIMCPPRIRDAGLPSYAGAEMDFPMAPSIQQAIIQRAQTGLPGYTLCDELYRDAVKWWMQTQRNLEISSEWIIPTHGTIFSLATVIRMATNPGESIITQPPIYFRYEQAATRLGRKTLYNRLLWRDGQYTMDLEGLEALMARPDSKILVLCNPQNPTGTVWDCETLTRVAQLAKRYDVLVYCDEIFADITMDCTCPGYLSIPEARSHAIVCTSLGKTFNLTGMNHANVLIADKRLADRFIAQRNADHYGSIDPWAYSSVLGAYSEGGALWKNAMVDYVTDSIRYIRQFFSNHLPFVTVAPSGGSYLLWTDWSGCGMTESQLEEFLENEALLHLSPGHEYNASRPCMARMCTAAPRHCLERSMEYLCRAAKGRGLPVIP